MSKAPNLTEIEQALSGRGWITLEASTVSAWIAYTRDLEAQTKPAALSFSVEPGIVVQSGIEGWVISGNTWKKP